MDRKKLLGGCVFFSFFLHCFALFLLQQHSVWFSASAQALTSHCPPPMPKCQVLKESFLTLSKAQTVQKNQPQKISEAKKIAWATHFQKIETIDEEPFQRSTTSHMLTSNDSIPKLNPPTIQPIQLNLPRFITQPRLTPLIAENPTSQPHRNPEPSLVLAPSSLPKQEAPQTPKIAYHSSDFNILSLSDKQTPRRALLTIPPMPLPAFPTLEELSTSSYSESFDTDLVFAPKPDQSGYIFALTVIPRADLQLPKLHQHYYFLIDRANSIQRERLLATKGAVLKAIENLAPDDTFNILVFDSKMEKLFSSAHSPDASSITQAREFLDKINLGSFFAPADLYNPLALTLPQEVQDDELYTAILLTDGENLAKKSGARAVLQNWTWQNNGRVSLFTVAMNCDLQLATLDIASALNKGHLYYSPTKRGIKRKLLKLMQCIKIPVAKNMSCRAISPSQKNPIQLYPRQNELGHLYLDQPFVIIGSCESMEDFILFIQGRLKDHWMNIKKKVSFINAKKGSEFLKQQWALQQAYQCYESYILDDNPAHLAEAQKILRPFDIQPAFQ